MEVRASPAYEVADREVVAEGADLRILVLTLAAGQAVPWHYHKEITDSFVGIEGEVVVETRAPSETYVLTPGQRCSVGPKIAHTVHGRDDGPCKVMVVQGVGAHDFILADGQESGG